MQDWESRLQDGDGERYSQHALGVQCLDQPAFQQGQYSQEALIPPRHYNTNLIPVVPHVDARSFPLNTGFFGDSTTTETAWHRESTASSEWDGQSMLTTWTLPSDHALLQNGFGRSDSEPSGLFEGSRTNSTSSYVDVTFQNQNIRVCSQTSAVGHIASMYHHDTATRTTSATQEWEHSTVVPQQWCLCTQSHICVTAKHT